VTAVIWLGPVRWWGGVKMSVHLSAGTSTVSHKGRYGGVRIVARDAAGNRSAAVTAGIRRS
jgi:hypothetical protein